MLEAIRDKVEQLLKATGKTVNNLVVTVEHNVEKPDFKGDLYKAEAVVGGKPTPLVSWTVGELFKDDPSIVTPTAERLVERMLENQGEAE